MTAPIGGRLISSFGGVLGFQPFQGILPSQGVPPPTTFQTLLDHMQCRLVRERFVDNTTHTGTFGARSVGIEEGSWQAQCQLKWDLTNPPDFLCDYGTQTALPPIDNGYQFWFYVGAGANYPVDQVPYYYFGPSAKSNLFDAIVNAMDAKKVEANFTIIGNSPLFKLNTSGTGLEIARYNAYIAHCATRAWVW
jgi:hypothetical protein